MSLTDERALEALHSAWKVIDAKDEGIIDFDEWHASIQRLNCGLTETQIRNVFKLIDTQSSGHIDATDFFHAVANDDNKNNAQLWRIVAYITGKKDSDHSTQTANDKAQAKEDGLQEWKEVFDATFDGKKTVSQEVWIQKMMDLNVDTITTDDLRLFHAVMDTQFRSYFDFDEFYETFTVQSLHHQEMDSLRDQLKEVLLPNMKEPEIEATNEISIQTDDIHDAIQIESKANDGTQIKETKEISIQTDDIHAAIQTVTNSLIDDALEYEYDEEIDTLERHIVEEEKYLEIMDEIDKQKKKNENIFKWDNVYRWNEYHVIQWLHDIGFKQAEYMNRVKEKHITGDVLVNTLSVDMMVSELEIDEEDALLIEKCIFILKNIKNKVLIRDVEETKENERNDNKDLDAQFYKRRCENLMRELKKMRRIEQMFKKNRRCTESKLKQLECNLYFGTLSEKHLMGKFDINQLFEIQAAHNKTLKNIQKAIQCKVKNVTQGTKQ